MVVSDILSHGLTRNLKHHAPLTFSFYLAFDNFYNRYCDDCDLVTADARQNQDTNYYNALNLTCPDGAIESIDLTGEKISDRDWLRKQLPNYCRESCDELYRGH